MTKMKKSIIAFAVCIVVAVVSMFAANNIQTNGGKVNVVTAAFEATKSDGETYNVTYKIYIPEGVDHARPAPALLCLHDIRMTKKQVQHLQWKRQEEEWLPWQSMSSDMVQTQYQ